MDKEHEALVREFGDRIMRVPHAEKAEVLAAILSGTSFAMAKPGHERDVLRCVFELAALYLDKAPLGALRAMADALTAGEKRDG